MKYNTNEKVFTIARTLSQHYGIPMPEFSTINECYDWIKTVLARFSVVRYCPYCQGILQRKLVNGKTRHVCKHCNKTFPLCREPKKAQHNCYFSPKRAIQKR